MIISQLSLKGFYAICRVLLFYIISIVIFATSSGVTKNVFLGDQLSFLISTILTFLLVVLFAKWEKLPLKDVGLIPYKSSLLRFSSGFGISVVMVVVEVLIITNFAKVKFSFAPHIPPINVITSLILFLLVACREELVFRSYSLRSLANSLNPIIALVIMTTIFIIEHVIAGMSWKMAVLGPGFGGILFGISALKTRGLALPLGLHFSWNFMQWLLGFKNNSGVWREIVEKGHESQAENIALAAFVFVMSATIVGIWQFYTRKES
ncbi:type II CAAX endopeptidase family protein [uncultured Flavobacterium sp.]|uniref:CPBP family intramembrane glutamic endopeptidase n=1 Tax=uncultured Flavobacterium sp. TaxID=165435 RepID=UPI002930B5EC|nr:type II CAAX endopeptidase family protein [uncultured Flavobacterium sp.]